VEHIQPYGAVILDYKMPKVNGIDVEKEILSVNPRQRIIFA
jgi:FixJ family two-component response regulator